MNMQSCLKESFQVHLTSLLSADEIASVEVDVLAVLVLIWSIQVFLKTLPQSSQGQQSQQIHPKLRLCNAWRNCKKFSQKLYRPQLAC